MAYYAKLQEFHADFNAPATVRPRWEAGWRPVLQRGLKRPDIARPAAPQWIGNKTLTRRLDYQINWGEHTRYLHECWAFNSWVYSANLKLKKIN
jgi:hypothetical protein